LENDDNRYKYAKQCSGTLSDKYDENWCDTIEDERKVYFALCIIMTVVKKSTTREAVYA
jgi:hypothetical protein